MKRYLFSIALMSLAIAFVGCKDDLVKDDIDAKNSFKVELQGLDISDVTYNSITVSYVVEGEIDSVPVYCGVLLSEKEDFSEYSEYRVLPAEKKTIEVFGNTTYFAKAYVVTGTGTLITDVATVKTPVAPEFKDKFLLGSFLAYDDDDDSYMYEMEISPMENTYNRIYISNWWDGGEMVTAHVDFDTKTIIVDDYPKVMDYSVVDPSFGWVIFLGVNDDDENTPNPIGYYDEDGNVTFPIYDIFVEGLGPKEGLEDDYAGSGKTDMIKQ